MHLIKKIAFFIVILLATSCYSEKAAIKKTQDLKSIKVSSQEIEHHMSYIANIGNLGPSLSDGFLRASWSNEETKAMEYIRKEASTKGLISRYDEVGNLYIRTPGNFTEIIQVGSHLDTVPRGGNYDGAAGIVAGLEAINAVIKQNQKPEKGLELIIWRGEESATFGAAHKGCKMAFGKKFKDGFLGRTFRGVSLETAMLNQNSNPVFVKEQRPTINQKEIDSIAAHIELHIEQAKKLEVDGDDIGIVTSIRGPDRYRIEVFGEYDHSGATPMGINYRKDANLAISHMQVALDELAQTHLKKGNDLVQTIGLLNSNYDFNEKNKEVYNNALTKVSGYGYFTIDFRSNNKAFRTEYVKEAIELLKTVANRQNVKIKITSINSSNPAEKLSKKVQKAIEEAAKSLNYKYQYMPSGAGHDAAIVSQQKKSDGTYIPTGMIFIPCLNGKSHAKEEFASTEQITKGANTLAVTISVLLNEK